MDSSATKQSPGRIQAYKHHGKDADELRRRRNQYTVSLRKTKRDEQIQSKRNLLADDAMSDAETENREGRQTLTINEILSKASSTDIDTRYEAVRAARKLLSIDRNPPIDELIHANFLPLLVECLTLDAHPNLQFEAAWALTNIASGNSAQTQAVADVNALPYLLRLLDSPHENVCEQSVWALGNLIGDGPRIRDYAIQAGVIRPLVEFIHKDVSIVFLRNVTWVIVNLCRHKEPPLAIDAARLILPALKSLILFNDVTILVDCTWALAYLLDCGNDMIQVNSNWS